MTASTLYEALEPEILWKPLLTTIFKEISGDGAQTEVSLRTYSTFFLILKINARLLTWPFSFWKRSHMTKKFKQTTSQQSLLGFWTFLMYDLQ